MSSNPISRFFTSATKIEPNEFRATALSFLFVFILMTAYTMLRPIRDSLAGDWGNVGLSATWTANFVLSVIAVSAYGAALSAFRFRRVVPGVYAFFALTFFALYFSTGMLNGAVLVNKVFYVWVSVFALFHLSVFWSFMSDLFAKPQASRLFGIIAAGASAGAIAGPAITGLFVDGAGHRLLVLIAATMMLLPLPIIMILERLRVSDLQTEHVHADVSEQIRIGKNPFAGFSILFSSRFLMAIGAFILLYVTISTFVYFELQNLTAAYEINTRTRIWAQIDLATNVLTFLIAIFVTNRIVTNLGMPTALGLVPAVIAFGVLVLVAAPALAGLAVFQVLRRVGNYAITRPAREMLYTVVEREARFKTKPVIDVVLYRGGDMMTAWLFTALSTGLGLGLTGIAITISGVAAVWATVAIYLGRKYDQKEAGASDA